MGRSCHCARRSAPKFAQLLVDGKITDEQYEEWNRSTGKKDLPERVNPKTANKTTRRQGDREEADRAHPGIGSRIVNVLPSLIRDSTSSVPPCCLTIRHTDQSPTPLP